MVEISAIEYWEINFLGWEDLLRLRPGKLPPMSPYNPKFLCFSVSKKQIGFNMSVLLKFLVLFLLKNNILLKMCQGTVLN